MSAISYSVGSRDYFVPCHSEEYAEWLAKELIRDGYENVEVL